MPIVEKWQCLGTTTIPSAEGKTICKECRKVVLKSKTEIEIVCAEFMYVWMYWHDHDHVRGTNLQI